MTHHLKKGDKEKKFNNLLPTIEGPSFSDQMLSKILPCVSHIHWPILLKLKKKTPTWIQWDGNEISLWCIFVLISGINCLVLALLSSRIFTCSRQNFSREDKNMEACFLSSNSFTKSIELVAPSIKARSLSFPKRNSSLSHSRKVAFPTSITCCHLDSPSPLGGDDNKPTLDSDWRFFRARLVAAEKVSRPEDSSSWADPDTAADQPPSVSIGDKWAHTIHEPEKGCLLIATEKLDGVHIFERTVILLLSTGPIHPSGIILNRPSLMSIKEMRSTVLDVTETFSDKPLFFGGPLEEGLFLVSTKGDDIDNGVEKSGVFEEIMKGLYYGTKESVGCAAEMVKRNVIGVEDFRFFDGYCGWEKEQLNEEIRAGYWTVAACSPSVIGLTSVGSVGLWEDILGLMGPRKVW